jgi:hypothetical protein
MNVMRASLVINSGDQVLDLNSATVNGHHVDVPDTVPGPSSSSTEVGTWQPVGDPTFGDWQKLAGSESTSDWSEVSRTAAVQTNAVPAEGLVQGLHRPDGYANLDGNSRVLENPGVFELK